MFLDSGNRSLWSRLSIGYERSRAVTKGAVISSDL